MLKKISTQVIFAVVAKCSQAKETSGCIGKCTVSEEYSAVQYLRHNDCGKYCVCVSGKPTVHECKKLGDHWSEALELCTDPAEAKCETRDDNCRGVFTELISPTGRVLIRDDDCTERPPKDDAVAKGCRKPCPAYMTHLIPHKECSKYCRCEDGKSDVKYCPMGSHFSEEKGDCVDPKDAKCDAGGDVVDEFGCIGICTVDPDPEHIILIPHEQCWKYCRCFDGNPKVRLCPKVGGNYLHFSVDEAMCVNPEEAHCLGIGGVTPPTRPPATRPPATRPPATRPPATRPPATRPPATRPPATRPPATRPPVVDDAVSKGCQAQCPKHSVLIGHHDCDKYCRCENGWSTVENCPAGLWFSERLRECVYPDESGCYGEAPKPPPTRPPATRPPATRPPATRPPATRPPATRPPATRPPATRPPATRPPATRPPPIGDNKGCIGRCPLHNSLNYTVHLPHEECSKFCKCDWGKPYVFECPDHLHFNPIEEVCDYTFNVNCTGIGSVIDWLSHQNIARVGNSLINEENVDADFTMVGEAEESMEDQEDFAKEESSKNSDPIFMVGPHADVNGCIGRCPLHNSPDYTVHLPHENCREFCKCNWGKTYVFECPDDLHFNPREDVCDFPFNVNCTGLGGIGRERVENRQTVII